MLCDNLLRRFYSHRRTLPCECFQSGVFRSALVPNLAISLFRTFISGIPGSRVTVLVGDVRVITLPGKGCSKTTEIFLRLFGHLSD